jgi:hypothetical protein
MLCQGRGYAEAARILSKSRAIGRDGVSARYMRRQAILDIDQQELTAAAVHQHHVYPFARPAGESSPRADVAFLGIPNLELNN